jgi:MraZ protein
MFRGSHPTRADEKGRVKVPAEYKRLIDEQYGVTFYITSTTGKVAEVYPMEEWEKIERSIATLAKMHPARKKFLNVTSYYGQVVEMDGQGRLLLPALLRETANLKGDVSVVGLQDHLEVRNMEAFTKEIEENPFTDEDANTLSSLGI